MSRAALWRQEGNVKDRERQAEELFRLAVTEGRNNRAKNLIPMWGPDDSFHFNPMLLQNIIKSSYFQKCCRDITDWNSLVDQIYYDVKHVEPWAQGAHREPSEAFCLLLRLLTLRCTEKQMTLLLTHADSPYIRAIGFLYLRFAGDPKEVYKWIEPYLYDDEPIQTRASSIKRGGGTETMGEYVRRIFTDKNYDGTIFPRLPVEIERDIQVKLLQAEKNEERAKKHAGNSQTMNYFQKLGSRVMALYGDEENPITWYEAVVDRVITTDQETQQKFRHPKFVVTFTEYGNTETVTLGEMEMMGVSVDRPSTGGVTRGGYVERSNNNHMSRLDDRGSDYRTNRPLDRNRGYAADRGYDSVHSTSNARNERREANNRGYGDTGRDRGYHNDRWQRGDRGGPSQSTSLSETDLYEEVRRRERETVTSANRNAFSRRPPSTKESLSSSNRDRSAKRSRSPDPYHRLPAPPSQQQQQQRPQEGGSSGGAQSSQSAPANVARAPEDLAAIRAKKQKLLAKYG